jgi:hypothetical protein
MNRPQKVSSIGDVTPSLSSMTCFPGSGAPTQIEGAPDSRSQAIQKPVRWHKTDSVTVACCTRATKDDLTRLTAR